jgi:hypothetical protein
MRDRHRAVRTPAIGWLAVGDILAFVLFAALGRHQHQESNGPVEALIIAAPFIVGWFAVAPWFGAFRPGPPREMLQRTALAWLCAWPVCLLLRALVQRRAVPIRFDLVALLVNALFLLAWRGVVAMARRGWESRN